MDSKEREQLIKVLKCLIDTAERTTYLENVYNDAEYVSVSWSEVYESLGRIVAARVED